MLTITAFSEQFEIRGQHVVEKDNDYNILVKYPAMYLWQYHFIGRLDNAANVGMLNHKGHDRFDFTLKTKVQW